ncbi:MAG: cytochrome P450 [Alphaproteobacteria bacterium]|nr:cytochrome P450 [Alphaproteobacteria bacterium]MBM3641056.1 cytochrome P450 [Alphaproteobacteria bacterium]
MSDPPLSALAHIPGTDGWPFIGNTLQLLADPKGTAERFAKLYGPVHRSHSFGGRTVSLLGPDANEFVLMDQEKVFSSKHGWERVFELLFPGGLIMRDFDEHRLHRKALAVAFKPEPMKSYLMSLNQGIATAVAAWKNASPDFRLYPAIKKMTLDLAAVSFLGDDCGPDLDAIKQAYVDMIAACVGVVRRPIPGTQMRRGVKAREFMIKYLGGQIAARRASDGHDLFTQLCKATTDDGALLTPQEVLDHMSFLMMAAHDTLASSLTSFVYFLSVNPDWQEKLREEIRALDLVEGEPLPYERLDGLPLTEMAFNESLRLIPPAPSILRRAERDTEFAGFPIPRGTHVAINVLYTHHMPELWPEPERFDPLRFTSEAIAARHKYAFIGFGGGAHMCLGLRFAYMQAKCFAYRLLTTCVISARPNYKPDWKYWPIPMPRDGLQVKFSVPTITERGA